MHTGDTIVAISSATGPAARMIVRLAGPAAFGLLRTLAPSATAAASAAEPLTIEFDGIVVPAWVYTFVGPHSYTGDDLVELHVPGHPLLARTLVEWLVAGGARPAGPGEFTARAFFSGRLDLAAAEGVALTIAATHAGELRAARQLLAGELSRRLAGPLESLAEALALIESNLDFAEEDIAFIDVEEVRRRITAAAAALDDLARQAPHFDRVGGEPTFVLVGLPNAGKSTLLNALAGHERAIVSPVAGTTRDALSVEIMLRRGRVRIVDVAGLETGADEVGRQMQERARRAIEAADFVIDVRDGTNDEHAWLPRPADVRVRTKADLITTDADAAVVAEEVGDAQATLTISAMTGNGIDRLREHLDALAFDTGSVGDTLALTARHVAAVDAARIALGHAAALPDDMPELIAESVRQAVDLIGQILGRVTPDDVLGRVFAAFCVGK